MAENLELATKRTGGRVVDCSGLENPLPDSPKTAEMADFCGVEPAQDAMFAKRSARRVGTEPGTIPIVPLSVYWRLIRTARKYALIADDAGDHEMVYFVQPIRGGNVKIGYTKNPFSRLAALNNMSPEPLDLIACSPGGREVESLYHAAFADARQHGEWFEPTQRLRRECEKLASMWIG